MPHNKNHIQDYRQQRIPEFAMGAAKLNERAHDSDPSSPRAMLQKRITKQFPSFDPESGIAHQLMRQRNPGRRLSSLPEMKAEFKKVSGGQELENIPEAFSIAGTGKAYVAPKFTPEFRKTVNDIGGRISTINHEFEHAYDQDVDTPKSVREIAPVMGDLVFTAESARRQAGRPITGSVPFGYKNQDIEWMRHQAAKHGYFGGRSMTDLLRTPEGVSWLKQATLGQKTPATNYADSQYAVDAGGRIVPLSPTDFAGRSFDPLAPGRPPLPIPSTNIGNSGNFFPIYPQDSTTESIDIDSPSFDRFDPQRKERMRKLIQSGQMQKMYNQSGNMRAVEAVYPDQAGQSVSPFNFRTNNQVQKGYPHYRIQRDYAFIPNTEGEIARQHRLEADRQAIVGSGLSYADDKLEPFDMVDNYPGSTKPVVVPRPTRGRSIRDALKKYEDNPMGGYYTPTQTLLFPYYKMNTPEIRANIRARYGN